MSIGSQMKLQCTFPGQSSQIVEVPAHLIEQLIHTGTMPPFLELVVTDGDKVLPATRKDIDAFRAYHVLKAHPRSVS